MPRPKALTFFFRLVMALFLVAGLIGCVTATYTEPDTGRRFYLLRIGGTEIDDLKVVRTHEGTTIEMAGYRSDGSELAESFARGAVSAALGGRPAE